MLLAMVAGPGLAAPEGHGVGMRIVATDPDEGETLAPDGALYLRVGYDSAVPVRVRAKGFIGDAEAGGGRRYNPAPVYPAGTHEALAWISFSGAAAIDEIRLYAYDVDWKLIGTASVPVSFAWGVPGKRHAGKAPWVKALGDRQESLVAEQQAAAPDQDGPPGALSVGALMAVAVPAYIVLQIVMLWWFDGRWRTAAALPLVVMIPVLLYTATAFAMEANLWPLLMLFVTPVALLYLLVVLAFRTVVRRMAPS